MALDQPDVVQSLCLLEPSLLAVSNGEAFFKKAQPAFDAYQAGRHEAALGIFMSLVSGLTWEACRALLEERIPGSVAQAVKDVDTFFGVELPGLGGWKFGAEEAARIRQPALSVLGAQTQPLWVEVDERLQAWLPKIEQCKIDGAGHLLHIQRPTAVARGIADFLGRHAMSRTEAVMAHNQNAAAR